MQIGSAFHTGVIGLQKASDGITENAKNIANNSISSTQAEQAEQTAAEQSQQLQQNPRPNNIDSLTDLLVDKNAAAANIKAIQTSSDLIGNIIDIKA